MTPSQLSFLPDDYLERKARRRTNFICAMLFIVVMSTIVATFMYSERTLRADERDNLEVSQEYTEAAKLIKQVQEMQKQQRTMAQQAELTASLLEKVPRSFVLAEITNAMPSGVSLLDFHLESKRRTRPVVTAPKPAIERKRSSKTKSQDEVPVIEAKVYDVHMKITGVAGDDVQVSQFMSRLNQSKLLRDVNLIISDQFKREQEQVRRFQIGFMLDPNAEVQTNRQPNTNTTVVEIQRN